MNLKSFCRSLLLSMAFLQSAALATAWADASLTAYHAKSGEFSLPVPSAWSIQEDSVIEGYKIPLIALRPSAGAKDLFQDNLNVTTEPIPASMSTGGYMDANIKVMSKALNGMKVVKTGDLKGGFTGSKYLIYTHQTAQVKDRLKVISFFFTNNSKGYVVTCTSTINSFTKFYPLYSKVGMGFTPGK